MSVEAHVMTPGGGSEAARGLELTSVALAYGECVVLRGVDFAVAPGEVHALVGENGAGKSTLIKVACGLARADQGRVRVDGRAVPPADARAAIAQGVGVVHQHFMLVDTLTVAENVVLGHEPRRGPLGLFVDRARARREVRALAERYKLPVDPDARVEALGVGERQRVELLKVLYRGARYVLLDEPTAVLSPQEVRALLDVVRGLARGGAGVVLVSHKLDEVFAVADRITVLRRGQSVLHAPRAELAPEQVARAVVGGDVPAATRARETPPEAREGIAVRGLRARGLADVTLAVRAGEVLGIAGVEGNGQRALCECVAGLAEPSAGAVFIAGEDAARWSVRERRARGLGYVPEDREGTGLLGELTIAENLALGDADGAAATRWLLPRAKLREHARAMITRFGIRPEDPDAPVRSLSGGNAQKVLIARELARPVRALLVAQPTRGVDLGAAAEIRAAIAEARDRGAAVLLVSSELDELRELADRVAVMRGGRVVGEVPVREATDERLGPWMVGG